MSFNVQQFRSSLLFEGARASLFEVVMTFPAGYTVPSAFSPGTSGVGSGEDPNVDVTFKAKATSLPGDSLSQITLNYFGREIKVAGTRTFPEWSMSVINDENFVIRNSFEYWMSGINQHVANTRDRRFVNGNVVGGYTTDVYINQFAKTSAPASALPIPGTGQIVKSYKLVGAFPIDVAAIDLDWASGDQIEEFSVTFAYQWWESVAPVPTTDSTQAI